MFASGFMNLLSFGVRIIVKQAPHGTAQLPSYVLELSNSNSDPYAVGGTSPTDTWEEVPWARVTYQVHRFKAKDWASLIWSSPEAASPSINHRSSDHQPINESTNHEPISHEPLIEEQKINGSEVEIVADRLMVTLCWDLSSDRLGPLL